jgi:hypothetical protein
MNILFQTEFENDFNFPDEETIISKRHFEIKYDIAKDSYKIKNITGSGLFIKIIKKTVIIIIIIMIFLVIKK